MVPQVNGWTVTVRPPRRHYDRTALTVQEGCKVIHLELDNKQMRAFDPDSFWRATAQVGT
jgi:hypothetical protein